MRKSARRVGLQVTRTPPRPAGTYALDDHAHVGVVEGDAGLVAQPHAARRQQGGPHLPYRVEEFGGAVDGGDGVVDPGGGEAGQVLGVGGGAHDQADAARRGRAGSAWVICRVTSSGSGVLRTSCWRCRQSGSRTSTASSSSAIFSLPMPCWRAGEEVRKRCWSAKGRAMPFGCGDRAGRERRPPRRRSSPAVASGMPRRAARWPYRSWRGGRGCP